MPISKPDHVQVHRIEFAKGTNLPRLIDEVERSIQSARYASYATVGVAALGVAGVTYGLYKIGQGLADAWETWLLPDWVNPDFRVWSDENRANFREAKPTLFEQIFAGPEILWAMARNRKG